MISSTVSRDNNDLLAAIPQPERDRVLNHCEHVTLMRDEILGEPGEHIRYAYFPIDGSISLLTQVDRHDALAVGLIGSDGMLGNSLVLGVHTSPLRARVQVGGSALRMKATDLQRDLIETPLLDRQLRFYQYVMIEQIAQTAACAAFHVVEERLAYWLLMTLDRVHGDRFYMTHDLLAHMLGVRRSGVTTAAGVLHRSKLIAYARGHITVLDRKGLEQAACGCYRVVRDTVKQIDRWSKNYDSLEEDYGNRPIRHAPGEIQRLRALPTVQGDSAGHLVLGAKAH